MAMTAQATAMQVTITWFTVSRASGWGIEDLGSRDGWGYPIGARETRSKCTFTALGGTVM